MRVTDEMVDAARDAVRQVTGGAFTPSAMLMRTALEAALDAAPPWIKCSERMPEPGVEVLVWMAAPVVTGGIQVATDTWDEQYESPVSWSSATIPIGMGWDSGTDWEDITHWMPLPAAPGNER